MDRQITYQGAIPLDTDILLTNKNAMIGLGYLIQAVLGAGTWVDGLACAPTGPAGMTVNVGPGAIYAVENIDGSAYGSLAPDTAHQIMKQGLSLNTTNLSCPAPVTSGQSINYLVEAIYEDVDGGSVVLPYFNASNPNVAYNGPGNTGVSQNTVRQGVCLIQVKAGIAAATGTQTTPSPDAGFTGLFVVTVANGQTTITSGNIAQLASAPFVTPKLTGVLAALQSGAAIYAPDTSGAANTLTIALTPAVGALAAGMRAYIKVANANTGAVVINTNGLGNVAANLQNGSAIPSGGLQANGIYLFAYDGSHWQLQSVNNTIALGQCYFQYTSGTVVTLVPSKGNQIAFPSGAIGIVPSAGYASTITSCYLNGTAAQTLLGSTFYYAYAAIVSGSLVVDFSTTVPIQDSGSGIMIKTGDATRVLVGAVYASAAPNFFDQDGARWVISWFNRTRKRSRSTFSTPRSTASTSFVEINSEIRNQFISWGAEAVQYSITGGVSNSSTQTVVTGIAFDGTTLETEASNLGVSGSTNSNGPIAIQGLKAGLSEAALHYATLMGAVNAGTSTWDASNTNSTGTVALNLMIWG